MSIIIIKPGVFSTVQDHGRTSFLDQAVPMSGVMDKVSANIANLLVGNDGDAALIEVVDGHFECIAETDVLVALVAGNVDVEIDHIASPINRPVFMPKGSVLHLKNNIAGRYAYLAIAGGWDVPEVLGSKSTYVTAAFGGYHGRRLQKGDALVSSNPLTIQNKMLFESLESETVNWPKWSIPASSFSSNPNAKVRVVLGREFDWFDDSSVAAFLDNPYQYSNGNRMGYRLVGTKINRKESQRSELLSTAVVPGMIQVTGDGSIILLMVDCQTTGGYPRLAKVAEVDLPICAQLKPGNPIHFEVISLEDAEMLYIKRDKDFENLATFIQLKIGSYNG